MAISHSKFFAAKSISASESKQDPYEALKSRIKAEKKAEKYGYWTDNTVKDKSRFALEKDKDKTSVKEEEKTADTINPELANALVKRQQEEAIRDEAFLKEQRNAQRIKTFADLKVFLRFNVNHLNLVRSYSDMIVNMSQLDTVLTCLSSADSLTFLTEYSEKIADFQQVVSLMEHLSDQGMLVFIENHKKKIKLSNDLRSLAHSSLADWEKSRVISENINKIDSFSSLRMSIIPALSPQSAKEVLKAYIEKATSIDADVFAYLFDFILSKDELPDYFLTYQEKIFTCAAADPRNLLEVLLCQDFPKDKYEEFIIELIRRMSVEQLRKGSFLLKYVPENRQDEVIDMLVKKTKDFKDFFRIMQALDISKHLDILNKYHAQFFSLLSISFLTKVLIDLSSLNTCIGFFKAQSAYISTARHLKQALHSITIPADRFTFAQEHHKKLTSLSEIHTILLMMPLNNRCAFVRLLLPQIESMYNSGRWSAPVWQADAKILVNLIRQNTSHLPQLSDFIEKGNIKSLTAWLNTLEVQPAVKLAESASSITSPPDSKRDDAAPPSAQPQFIDEEENSESPTNRVLPAIC